MEELLSTFPAITQKEPGRTTAVYKQPTRPPKLVVVGVEGVGQQSFVESSSSRTQEEEYYHHY